VPPFETDQSRPVLAGIAPGAAAWRTGYVAGRFIGLSLVAIAALWWGLNHWLDSLIATLLGAGK
jgi:type VI secretion system protein ImpK